MRYEVAVILQNFAVTSYAYISSPHLHRNNNLFPHTSNHYRKQRQQKLLPLYSDDPSQYNNDDDDDDIVYDPNRWLSTDDVSSLGDASWEESLARREDGSLWSSFASSDDDKDDDQATNKTAANDDEKSTIDSGEEAWLDTLASIAADEVEFMSKEADRADKVRQMQELGFSSESIGATLGVAVDETEMEDDDTNEILKAFKEETSKTGFGLMVDEDIDLQVVESHSRVDWDGDMDEPVRAQHVYVDEVTCIGCTNCAMIAQSTFFMEGEHGRARVFQQWGGEFCFMPHHILLITFYD